ncbi:hypothetical protein SSPSH_001302 [Salinisphaera shabanensis E1L3A]|uniref:Metallothionein n=1 Tax=Salinisphaera shabanensis E1L3A TaxID=1033802 RepID=U2E7W5_9GAMM|nr:hypothetical protein [Salinisphaera shabanensis]ERJ19821.1 hypothetical protein SSPSH_001302 [Salinisphaera shabanensis E1L3A]
MPSCDCCGNDYDKAFTVETAGGRRYTFDSIECAANVIAPTCQGCGCRILGHGMGAAGHVYCCAHCAEANGAIASQDHA